MYTHYIFTPRLLFHYLALSISHAETRGRLLLVPGNAGNEKSGG